MGSQSGTGGFTVDPAALHGVAGQLGRAYDDFQVVRTDFAGNQCLASSAFGEFGMAEAWSGFSTAWSAELTVTSDAIKELITKVDATADHFAQTETHVTASLGPR